jgi:hypothetical protein
MRTAVQGTHLVSLKEKQRLYFLYEKRIRELSNAEKVYEYFANEKRGDGSAFMRPQVLLGTFWGFQCMRYCVSLDSVYGCSVTSVFERRET